MVTVELVLLNGDVAKVVADHSGWSTAREAQEVLAAIDILRGSDEQNKASV